MTKNGAVRIVIAGLVGGFLGNGLMGALFSSPPVQSILYNPEWQSPLFIELTPKRNIPLSVAGLVVLSGGLSIWLMYWLFQEWFIYNTLLGEPLLLNLLELVILLSGTLVEGLVIAFLLARSRPRAWSK